MIYNPINILSTLNVFCNSSLLLQYFVISTAVYSNFGCNAGKMSSSLCSRVNAYHCRVYTKICYTLLHGCFCEAMAMNLASRAKNLPNMCLLMLDCEQMLHPIV